MSGARRALLVALLVSLGMWGTGVAAGRAAPADSRPNDTWVALGALPERPSGAVLALAADPADARHLVVGTLAGNVYRSIDGGGSWALVKSDLGHGVVALTFDPFDGGAILAGTRGAGAWRSTDGGQSWQAERGTEGRTVRAFGFWPGVAVAGTDRGVWVSRAGGGWAAAGLAQVAVTAIDLAPSGDPARVVAGGDAGTLDGTPPSPGAAQPLLLFNSGDGGQTWAPVSGTLGDSTIVSVLGDGATVAHTGARPVLVGTNAGLFSSSDSGATWQPLGGAGNLPTTDVTGLAYVSGHDDRYYVGSDGGGSASGGLWVTRDGGAHFGSLQPPAPAVTALAVSGGDLPVVYTATLRPGDQRVRLWAYRDDAGAPRGVVDLQPSAGPAQSSGGPAARGNPQAAGPQGIGARLMALVRTPEAPYVALGVVALLVLAAALVAYLRRTRDL